MSRRVLRAFLAGVLLLPFAASTAIAHPLGNFTINHHVGIRVEPDRVLLDVVIDQAEIPAFQATRAFDRDGDGALSAPETEAARVAGCQAVAGGLTLTIGVESAVLRLAAAGLSLPSGSGGLATMRLVCTLEAPLPAVSGLPGAAGAAFTFRDSYEPSRIGWREITVTGDRMTIVGDVSSISPSARLTSYPTGLATAPDQRSVSFTATAGGPALAPFAAPDATPVGDGAVSAGSRAGATLPPATVPGGDGAIPESLRFVPTTPLLVLVALLVAAALGAGHALTPGHGKTLMAAYLVGTRGTPRHALGLGLAVSVSHTAGILALAVVVVAAQGALPPDVVVRVAPLVAAVGIIGIGGWMLTTEIRRQLARRLDRGHEHPHEEAHPHPHGPERQHDHGHPHADELEHDHGGVRHRHVPPAGATVTWRSLFVLGLAGGLIPSTNALLILLATLASGQAAWGVILVVAFGLGMAAVMAGVGLAFVYGRGLLDRLGRGAARAPLARVAGLVPMATAVLVLVVGIALTREALSAAAVL